MLEPWELCHLNNSNNLNYDYQLYRPYHQNQISQFVTILYIGLVGYVCERVYEFYDFLNADSTSIHGNALTAYR